MQTPTSNTNNSSSAQELTTPLSYEAIKDLLVAIMNGTCDVSTVSTGVLRQVKIATHNHVFHGDEALAVAMLQLLPEFAHANIVRTRAPDVLATAHVLVDVGCVYDANRLLFDHHQQGFKLTFSNEHSVVLSSCGLTYKHYGMRIIKQLFGNLTDDEINVVYNKVYTRFVQSIDAFDNKVKQFANASGEEVYPEETNLYTQVNRLNPAWNVTATDADRDAAFNKAVTLTKQAFLDAVNDTVSSWLPACHIINAAMDRRHEVHSSGALIELERWCPFEEHVFNYEKAHGLVGQTNCILFNTGRQWQVTCVPTVLNGNLSRTPLPAKATLGHITGLTFVHASGFTGATETREAAIKLFESTLSTVKSE